MTDSAPLRRGPVAQAAAGLSALRSGSSAAPAVDVEEYSSLPSLRSGQAVPRPSSPDAPRVPPPASPPDLPRIIERWDELLDRLRAGGKSLAATALSHATPTAVSAKGDVTIALEEPNEFYRQAFEKDRGEVLAILREWFAGVERVQLTRVERGDAAAPPRRLTNEDIRVERLTALRKRDPVLGAAIDALDLDVAD